MEKISCSTADLAVENAKKLIGLFPECEGERGTVDFDKLRQVLSSTVVEGNVERYEFTWPGKRKAMAAASAATTKTLRPCVEESVGKDGTKGGFDSENLYIEGDNLEVLKLLQCNYAGKVKMIYIDPPYNTGHDFVYRDRFSLTDKELAQEGGAFDEDGNRFEKNDSAEARYHSNWCSMMYPRLKLARNLLRDDGVLFMSIDDNEVVNARKLCDEVFGEANFVAQVVWKNKFGSGALTSGFIGVHEYVIVYSKTVLENITRCLTDSEREGYNKTRDSKFDLRGGYVTQPLAVTTFAERPNLRYPINYKGKEIWPKKQWVWEKGRMLAAIENEEVVFNLQKDGSYNLRSKKYLIDENGKERRGKPITLYTEVYTQNGTEDIRELFKTLIFDYTKPVEMLKYFVGLEINDKEGKEDIILDFFSGSATTAHAVMKLNAEDGGSRKFIMVQLPEVCDEGSEAAKAGYKNICEIGKERIRRAGKKIREELATGKCSQCENVANTNSQAQLELGIETGNNGNNQKSFLDTGFRVLKLDSSSLNDTSATVSETVQEFTNFDRIKSDRSPEDLLFQILLETRISLSESIAKVKVGANEVFLVGVGELGSEGIGELASVGGAPLVACLDQKAKLDNEFFIELAKLKPEIVFFRDDAFTTDSARINVEQIFRQNSPSSAVRVI